MLRTVLHEPGHCPELAQELTASVIGVRGGLEGLIVCECRTTEQHGAA
jgi:hypothetical protein